MSPRSSPRCPDVAIVVIGSVLAGGQQPLLAIFLQRSQMFLKKMFVTYIAPTYFGPLPIIILAGTGNPVEGDARLLFKPLPKFQH